MPGTGTQASLALSPYTAWTGLAARSRAATVLEDVFIISDSLSCRPRAKLPTSGGAFSCWLEVEEGCRDGQSDRDGEVGPKEQDGDHWVAQRRGSDLYSGGGWTPGSGSGPDFSAL